MLKNPGKADLNKDGKLSGYEKKRGMAIEKNMKPMKAVVGALALGAAGALGAKKLFDKRKKTATSNTGKMPVGDLVENKKKELMGKRFGGVMKRSKGGGADTGKVGEMKSKIGVASNRVRRLLKNMKGAASSKEVKLLRNLVPGEAARGVGTKLAQAIKKSKANKMGGGMMKKYSVGGNVLHKLKSQKEIKKITDSDEYKKADYFGKTKMLGGKAYTAKEMKNKISKKMGGGMMNKPMGYKKGTSVMARGCKLGRKKPTKIM